MIDPAEWFGGARRVMFVHAHPDDESIGTGGTLAALAAEGLDPALVTLTRGERGEARPPFDDLAGTPGIAERRQLELATALERLGVERHVFLGSDPARADGLTPRVYEDSGMVWGADGVVLPDPEASSRALTRAAAVDALRDLFAAAYHFDAGALVSYNAHGGYGHPDHVFAHRAARAVAVGLEVPFFEITALMVPPSPDDDEGVERHEIASWADRKIAALRAHETQLAVEGEGTSAEIVHVGGQRQPIDLVEAVRRLG